MDSPNQVPSMFQKLTHRRAWILRSASMLTLALLVVGCGDYPRSRVYGKVKYQGVPVSDATIIFLTRDNMTYMADLKADGSYEVKNVPQGKVRVSLQPGLPQVAPRPDPVPGEYGKPQVGETKDRERIKRAEIEAEVQRGPSIPQIYTDPTKSGLEFELNQAEQEWSPVLK